MSSGNSMHGSIFEGNIYISVQILHPEKEHLDPLVDGDDTENDAMRNMRA